MNSYLFLRMGKPMAIVRYRSSMIYSFEMITESPGEILEFMVLVPAKEANLNHLTDLTAIHMDRVFRWQANDSE